MARARTTNRLVFRFERGLRPRNPVQGEVWKGGSPPPGHLEVHHLGRMLVDILDAAV
jgi:hypothetical protein